MPGGLVSALPSFALLHPHQLAPSTYPYSYPCNTYHRSPPPDPAVLQRLFEQGLMGIETSADHGGALAKVDPSVSVLCDVHNTLVNTVLGSFCLSESASGSDAFALQTRAVPSADGSFYTLNGSKIVDLAKGYKGITCFIVPKELDVKVAKKEEKLGIRASSTCTLNFDDVKVPAENVLGRVGKGYKIAIEILNEGRIGIAAQMLGLAQGAFDTVVPYTFERKQFSQPIGTFQGMQHQMTKAAIDIETVRLLTYNAARRKEEGLDFTKEAAMAKYHASQAAMSAIEWAGGVGFTRETGIEKYWRDSKVGAIYEGTSNIQFQTIAKFIQKQYS
ncbi:mitochondrial acyl-CoA dehydrogenase [Coprinellus micaceus]|uniref:short-chain 2-methylacyl-CoA dehydrogenase n=1 Tax=Coprinellus micaceus TaxID=71717 RepID=A0A4Y7T7M7_COPMI|nr:mitochondrial acyl-CoA dehydrogenase [Coprinellus micaceus]